MFSRILIANRGEIAVRIIRACHELGIEAVVVCSQADKDAAYVKMADEVVCIGPPSPLESYLNIPRIISAAEITDAGAIHPGYGFLAENAKFAEICRECGITFIGPDPDAMRLLGDKVQAREIAKKARVPVVPGSEGELKDDREALKLAGKIGYPVMLKAAAGGGGRGMRIAHSEISLRGAFAAARAEAEAAFKNGTLYMEKFIEQPRHVEVQLLADNSGNAVHFYERDCTVQRRHQKLIEECPCPVLDDETRENLCRAALRLIKEANYSSAATCEFLLDKDNNFYFIEVNTRIQVEHTITEMITGEDLVRWQIRLASGEPLTLRQKDIQMNGVAMECRINAEDPQHGYSPSPGRIERFIPPGGLGVRIDTHMCQGETVSPYYDSMIAKLIVHKRTRDEVINTMKRALREFQIEPIKTTIPAHLEILAHNKFVTSDIDTGFIEKHMG
ncbi:MAG: acetyl-CoA carboxylase biotin carboxylase subunit [Sedimentisphaerales bacterium]|nr:acetyl-CoA carboxylase biotin carboxylase subunit [Sedimentisphaerales bacterium]